METDDQQSIYSLLQNREKRKNLYEEAMQSIESGTDVSLEAGVSVAMFELPFLIEGILATDPFDETILPKCIQVNECFDMIHLLDVEPYCHSKATMYFAYIQKYFAYSKLLESIHLTHFEMKAFAAQQNWHTIARTFTSHQTPSFINQVVINAEKNYSNPLNIISSRENEVYSMMRDSKMEPCIRAYEKSFGNAIPLSEDTFQQFLEQALDEVREEIIKSRNIYTLQDSFQSLYRILLMQHDKSGDQERIFCDEIFLYYQQKFLPLWRKRDPNDAGIMFDLTLRASFWQRQKSQFETPMLFQPPEPFRILKEVFENSNNITDTVFTTFLKDGAEALRIHTKAKSQTAIDELSIGLDALRRRYLLASTDTTNIYAKIFCEDEIATIEDNLARESLQVSSQLYETYRFKLQFWTNLLNIY